jgi:hypothetical protein
LPVLPRATPGSGRLPAEDVAEVLADAAVLAIVDRVTNG